MAYSATKLFNDLSSDLKEFSISSSFRWYLNFFLPLLSLNYEVCFSHAYHRPNTWRIYCARLAAILFIVTVFHSRTTTTITSFNFYLHIYMFIYSTYFASLRRFIYYSLRVYSLLNFKYCLFCVYIYLCDFAKRCPLSQCSRNKTRGLAVLLGVNWEPRPRPIRGSVASLFCVKTRGVGRGDFVTLVRVLCPKAVQSQRIFPVA